MAGSPLVGRKVSDNVMIRSRLFVGLLAVLGASLSGCAGEAGDAPEPERAAEASQAIIGGTPAVGDKYAAVGGLVEAIIDPYYGILAYSTFCSATLVGPQEIITARHCTKYLDNLSYPDSGIFFAIGENAYFPDQYVQVVAYENAPRGREGNGLLRDGGRDVAVMYLDSEPEGVVPAKIGRFSKHMLGQKFEIVGFGRNDDFIDGARYRGVARARQMHGLWYSALFDHNPWKYWNWYWTDADTEPSWREGREWWRTYRLESGYELLAGGDEGEALGCFGDSGGPLLRGRTADELTVYGVGFATEASKSRVCDNGSAFLVFHKHDILRFLKRAL